MNAIGIFVGDLLCVGMGVILTLCWVGLKQQRFIKSLQSSREELEAAVTRNTGASPQRKADNMNTLIQTLTDEVAQTKEVEASALAFINGIAARQQAAVDAALANGATAEQLAPITDEVNAMAQSRAALAAAILANTPAAPVEDPAAVAAKAQAAQIAETGGGSIT